MKSDILKRFLDEHTEKSERKWNFDDSHQLLKTFFDHTAKMILEKELVVVLLDDEFEIKGTFSNDTQIVDEFKNKKFLLKTTSAGGKKFKDTIENNTVYIFISKLFSNSDSSIKYRFAILSLEQNDKRYRMLTDRLGKILADLLEYNDNTFSSYENLLRYLDAIDDGISACDSNGVLRYINKSACNMIEGKREDLLNHNLGYLTSNAILTQVIHNKKTYMDFEYFLEYNKKTFHLMNSAYPVYDKYNNVIGAIDIFKRIKRSMKIATDMAGHHANYRFEYFVGSSKALNDCIDLARKFAQSNKNILIMGESGTGKELFAQAIHNCSSRKDGPFVAINCASFPKDLFDSELFGYDEGAFTGARKGGKIGKFELANGGTLFLDEIGEMPIHLQAKMLRVLETRSISRIGSNKNIDIDVRIISATNRNLEQMVRNDNFRGDFYYRLKVLCLSLPPLVEREDDCIQLTNYFINKFSQDGDKKIKGINNEAKELIKAYYWPGNIRELENIIALSLFICDGEYITKEHLLKAGIKNVGHGIQIHSKDYSKLSEVTKELILQTLEKTNGNKRKAAELLGISRNTIYRTLNKYSES